MVRVKFCGITNLEDALSACELGVHALGFVFAASPRQIDPEKAGDIIKRLPPWVVSVGVFVDEKPGIIKQIAERCGIDWIQLHGWETPEYCNELKLKIIKTIKSDIEKITRYDVQGILLDTSKGAGMLYDWNLACEAKKFGKPIILSGGLSPENIRDAILKVKPYGVDVSSGIESSPGKKDYEKMKKFMEVVNDVAK